MEIRIKQWGVTVAPLEAKEGEDTSRSILFCASSEARDRDGDIVLAEGWDFDEFMDNPIFLWMHNQNELPVGRVKALHTADAHVYAEVEFAPVEVNPRGEQLLQAYKGGFLNAVSVGFKPLEYEPTQDGKGFKIMKQELIELSAVTIPANTDALVVRRSFEDDNRVKTLENKVASLEAKLDQQLEDLAKVKILSKLESLLK